MDGTHNSDQWSRPLTRLFPVHRGTKEASKRPATLAGKNKLLGSKSSKLLDSHALILDSLALHQALLRKQSQVDQSLVRTATNIEIAEKSVGSKKGKSLVNNVIKIYNMKHE
jgi:hypothetical protein